MSTATARSTTAPAAAHEQPGTRMERRVAALRAAGREDPAWAQDLAWQSFRELGRAARRDRDGASRDLDELFRSGTPPAEIDGPTEGILVTSLIAPPVDLAFRAVTTAWMPWLGKRFDRAAGRGENILRPSARLPARLLWPLYSTWSAGAGRGAFEFETRVGPGAVDPDRQTLAIDYSAVRSNPGLVIRRIRDELVEIVPGAHLGKILWCGRDGSHRLIGYFALRSRPDS